jgi:hypothetical protein
MPPAFGANLLTSYDFTADGVVRFCAPIPGPQTAQWVDSNYDVGKFAARKLTPNTIFSRGWLTSRIPFEH